VILHNVLTSALPVVFERVVSGSPSPVSHEVAWQPPSEAVCNLAELG
jgi:hypothetical protein